MQLYSGCMGNTLQKATGLSTRATIAVLDKYIIVYLIALGASGALVVGSLFCLPISKYFLIGAILGGVGNAYLWSALRNTSKLKLSAKNIISAIDSSAYTRSLEQTKDKLLARLLQEKICPWRNHKCLSGCESCLCLQQQSQLRELGLDTQNKCKILLTDSDMLS